MSSVEVLDKRGEEGAARGGTLGSPRRSAAVSLARSQPALALTATCHASQAAPSAQAMLSPVPTMPGSWLRQPHWQAHPPPASASHTVCPVRSLSGSLPLAVTRPGTPEPGLCHFETVSSLVSSESARSRSPPMPHPGPLGGSSLP
eukprot:1315316-Rhodomonas_salina.1